MSETPDLKQFHEEFIQKAKRLQDSINTMGLGVSHLMRSPQPILIGIGGKLASGKDTVADRLVKQHGFVKLGMSDPLADALYTLNPFIPGVSFPERDTMRYQEHVDAVGYTTAKEIPEVRRLLQQLGTEVGRHLIGENTWIDIAARRITEQREAGHPVILTGIRYSNELEMIRSLGGTSVYVDRPSAAAVGSGLGGHSSEVGLAKEDFEIILRNDSSLVQLYARTENMWLNLTKDNSSEASND